VAIFGVTRATQNTQGSYPATVFTVVTSLVTLKAQAAHVRGATAPITHEHRNQERIMAKILLFDKHGGIENLYFKDVVPPEPQAGEVRYRVESFTPNRADFFWVANTYYNSPTLPARVGLEACGVVDAVGPGVTEFKVGQRVSSLAQEDGNYCTHGEFAISRERYLVPCASHLSPEEGCTMWSQGQTAYYSLVELANVQPGQSVLVTAGSGSAGNGAIQIAKALGARVITTSRGTDKHDFLLGLGADAVIATDQENVADRIKEETDGKGVDVVFDNVTGSLMRRYIAGGLAQNARIFIVGMLELNFELTGSMLDLLRANATITGYSIFNHNRVDAQLARAKKFIAKAIAEGTLKPVIDSVFPFDQTLQAYARLGSGETRGKVIVRVSG
jgi:NADPH:quinone reductase